MGSEDVSRATEHRLAKRWYVMYQSDAYALGPLEFVGAVSADVAVAAAEENLGGRPHSVWPDGPTEEVDEYEFELGDET